MFKKLIATSSRAFQTSLIRFTTSRQPKRIHESAPKFYFCNNSIKNNKSQLDEAKLQKEAKEFYDNQVEKIMDLKSSADFEKIVTNTKEPILLDFYADWCEPCKLLTPRLESKVNQLEDVKLVKINIDKCPEIARMLKIKSVPTVYLIHQGQAVDKIEGNVSDQQLKAFFDLIVKLTGESPQNKEAINTLETAKTKMAEKNFEEAVQILEKFETSKITTDLLAVKELLLAQCYLSLNKVTKLKDSLTRAEQFTEFYSQVPDLNQFYEILIDESKKLSEKASLNPDIAKLQERIGQASSENELLEAKFELMNSYKNGDEIEKSLEVAMEIIQKNKNWEDKKTNKFVVGVFKELGNNSPIVQKYRKILQRLLS